MTKVYSKSVDDVNDMIVNSRRNKKTETVKSEKTLDLKNYIVETNHLDKGMKFIREIQIDRSFYFLFLSRGTIMLSVTELTGDILFEMSFEGANMTDNSVVSFAQTNHATGQGKLSKGVVGTVYTPETKSLSSFGQEAIIRKKYYF